MGVNGFFHRETNRPDISNYYNEDRQPVRELHINTFWLLTEMSL